MKREELVCKNCGGILEIRENEIAECTVCNCKYKMKQNLNGEYDLEPYIDFSNFEKTIEKEKTAANSSEGQNTLNKEKEEDNSPEKKHMGKVFFLFGGCACAAILAVVLGINFDKRQEKIRESQIIQAAETTADLREEKEDDFSENNNMAMTDFLPKSRIFKDFVSMALNKKVSEITKADMEEFKYIGVLYNEQYGEIEIQYSFGDYYANDNSHDELMNSIYYDVKNRLDLSDLNYFTGLTELDIEYGDIEKGDIVNLTKLRSYTGKETLEEMTKILNPKQMWHLCLQGGVDTVEGIEVYENLEELVINRGELADISPITKLSNLYYLTLRDCNNIKDFSPLNEMTSLDGLELQTEQLQDITFVKYMPFLQYLEVTDSQISNIEPLKDNKNIAFLELSGNKKIEDYSALNTLENLEILILNMGTSKETPNLSNLTKLQQLWLEKVTDTECLSSLTNLETLYLKFANITNPSSISQMENLVSLHMEQIRGEYENLGFLKDMRNLEYLDISNNEFYHDISDVFQIPNLERLYIDNCIFELDIENISEKLNLKYFSANNAKMIKNVKIETDGFMTDIYYDDVVFKDELGFLTKFPNLEYVELSENQLDSVEMFLPLTYLECLVINNNNIVSLAPLEALENLYVIYCTDNKIVDYGNLKENIYVIE